jgi:HD-GYP domain-containing protein (c-di-GMP phosphodiesterase class II)
MSTDVQTLERDKALAEVVRHRGTQFDPAVVDALLALERRELAPAA